ncbi:MAG: glycosyltransferase family 39 protein [Anaerolineales bacterium]|nr:glycosyltransferase family 39 protein [Anaerolineales bacterium]
MTQEQKTDNLILLLMALGAVIFHVALNGQYGFHRDELDFIMNARQLDWGYVSYPPLTPLFARIGLELFGESLRGLRVLPAIAQGIAMILAAWMARDMGGKRNAQILTAFAVFIAPVSLFGGTVIMYFAFDYLWWVMVAFFTVRLLATDDARHWLGIGAGIGLGMMTKYTMAFWVAGLVVAVLITPARKYLRSKWLYLGAALSLLIFLPNLIWQIQHDFIALDYLSSIHARDISWGGQTIFSPNSFFSPPIRFPSPSGRSDLACACSLPP